MQESKLKRIDKTTWQIDKGTKPNMCVAARIIATKKLLQDMDEGVYEQIINVACLPGLVGFAFAMPDAHWGYGCPVGGVFAVDPNIGIISPGAVGYDINCGIRLLVTNLTLSDVRDRLKKIVDQIYDVVPCGLGGRGFLKINKKEFDEIMVEGASWVIKKGYGWDEDAQHIEDYGKIPAANPEFVSQKAIDRGIKQLATLGSGNHYLEIQQVREIFNNKIAKTMGIENTGQITVMIHCGSRGFGHQIATDYIRLFENIMQKYGVEVEDKQLASVPFKSVEGQKYYASMAAAANFAFANRQAISFQVRKVFEKVFGKSARALGMKLIYDVAHNIAKIEKHYIPSQGDESIDSNKKIYKQKEILVHRKGATRSFGPQRKELPKVYWEVGQPVIIGGSMETGSYLLCGTTNAEYKTFSSTAHGSGRTMSRTAAKKRTYGKRVKEEMEAKGIYVKAASFSGLAEEAGFAYKDINQVVEAVNVAGISKPVASFAPLGNIKG